MGPPPPGGFVRKTRKSMAFQMDIGNMVLDEMVPLAESETPMIRKNQSMREDQSRRSSLGTRGNRARSSMDKGDTSESQGRYSGAESISLTSCRTVVESRRGQY
jgi:kinetochore protein Mis13/DSN1